MRGKIRTSSHQTYFVFITLFSKPTLTSKNIAYTKNSHKKMKFDFSVVVARRFKSSRGTAG